MTGVQTCALPISVQTGDEAVNHGFGDQIEAGDAGQDGRIKEAL